MSGDDTNGADAGAAAEQDRRAVDEQAVDAIGRQQARRHSRAALLADDVGLGKTAVALALVRDHPDALVVAPAALRSHWATALRDAGVERPVVTTESLGRAAPNAWASGPGPPVSQSASAVMVTTSPTVKNVTNASGDMPVRYALR